MPTIIHDGQTTTSGRTGEPSFGKMMPQMQYFTSAFRLLLVCAVLLTCSTLSTESNLFSSGSRLRGSTPSPTTSSSLSASRSPVSDVETHRRHGRRASAPAISSMTGSRETVLNLFVLEELHGGSKVGNVVRNYGLDRRYSPAVIDSLRFRLLSHPIADDLPDAADDDSVGNAGGEKEATRNWWFVVGEVDGIIRTGRVIDREKLCPGITNCYIMFDIVVQPSEYFQIIKVRVEILDTNDNAPTFPVPSKSIELSEAAEPDTSFLLPSADDLDSIKNGVVRYEIRPPTPTFHLLVIRDDNAGLPTAASAAGNDVTEGDNFRTTSGAAQLRLVLRERVDRETIDHFRFTVVAIDGGDPVRSGSLLVDVTVIDVNDNGPQFAPRPPGGGGQTPIEARLSESAPIGTTVHRVVATDPDDGPNGELLYELAPETLRDYGDQFTIDPTSGQIYIRSTLDHERQSVYVLYIVATDNGATERKSAQTSVVVRVDDVNDNAPRIRINGLTDAVPRPEVGNGSDAGTFVAHVTVDDPDAGQNGRFHCRVTTGSDLFELRQMYATEFKVVVAPGMRIVTSYPSVVLRLNIACRDNGEPEMTSALPLEVAVISRNDHAPMFMRNAYRFEVVESKTVGSTIGRVDATDVDTGPGGHVTYRAELIGGSRNCPVEVEPETGLLCVVAGNDDGDSFDRETRASCELDVIASDSGQPTRATRVRVTIVVIDVDDESVRFTSESYSFSVAENQPTGTEVGVVSAVDADLAPYNEVTYHVDQERRTSSSGVSVDVNEVAGDVWNELGPTGSTSAFSVDMYTGRVSTVISLDREKVSRYTLRVVASSTYRGVVMSATATVVIDVADLNDNAPVFEFPSEAGIRGGGIKDDPPIGSGKTTDDVIVVLDVANGVPLAVGHRHTPTLATIRAVDRDAGQNAQIEYRLVSVSIVSDESTAFAAVAMHLFDIDRRTGQLRLAHGVDWKSPEVRRITIDGDGVVDLEVKATDGGVSTSTSNGDDIENEIGQTSPTRLSTIGRLRVQFRQGDGGLDAVPSPGEIGSLPRRDDGALITVLSSEHLAVVLACTLAVILVVISIVVAVICLFRMQMRRRRNARLNHCEQNPSKTPPIAITSATATTAFADVGKKSPLGGMSTVIGANGCGSSDQILVTSSTAAALGMLAMDAMSSNGTIRICDGRRNGGSFVLAEGLAESNYEGSVSTTSTFSCMSCRQTVPD